MERWPRLGRLPRRMWSSRMCVVRLSAWLVAALVALVLLEAAGADAGTPRGRTNHLTVPGASISAFTRVLKVESARYTGPGTTTLFATKTLAVAVSAKADDLHDTLLAYATNRRCASRYQA